MEIQSVAVMQFGLSYEDFWELTPAQFQSLAEIYDEIDKKEDWRFGMLVSTVINMFGGKQSKKYGALEVMGREDESRPKIQSSQETMLRMRLFQAAMGRRGKANG